MIGLAIVFILGSFGCYVFRDRVRKIEGEAWRKNVYNDPEWAQGRYRNHKLKGR